MAGFDTSIIARELERHPVTARRIATAGRVLGVLVDNRQLPLRLKVIPALVNSQMGVAVAAHVFCDEMVGLNTLVENNTFCSYSATEKERERKNNCRKRASTSFNSRQHPNAAPSI